MGKTHIAFLTILGCAAAILLFNPTEAYTGDTLLTIDAGKIRGVIETPGSPVRGIGQPERERIPGVASVFHRQ